MKIKIVLSVGTLALLLLATHQNNIQAMLTHLEEQEKEETRLEKKLNYAKGSLSCHKDTLKRYESLLQIISNPFKASEQLKENIANIKRTIQQEQNEIGQLTLTIKRLE